MWKGDLQMKRRINLQLFADIDAIITANAQAFEGSTAKDQYTALTAKLGELGYDVLLNNKKQAEFIPSSRLSEVVSQRDGFKAQVEAQNDELQKLKSSSGDEKIAAQYQKIMDQNTALLQDLEKSKLNSEIVLAAKEAINPKDILTFIDMTKVKVNSKGEIIGVDAEIARLKSEKPYLFSGGDSGKRRGGMDQGGDKEDAKYGSMNAMIRRATGR